MFREVKQLTDAQDASDAPGMQIQELTLDHAGFPPSLNEILLTYNICQFKIYNVMIWYLYILQNGSHSKVS